MLSSHLRLGLPRDIFPNWIHGLWSPEVRFHIHKSSPIIPILRQMNRIPHTGTYFFYIHFNIVLPSTPRPSSRYLSCRFVLIFKAPLTSFILATWPAHLNFLDLIILAIWCERYELWSFSPWGLLHSSFSSLLDQIFALGSCFQIHLACIPPLM